MNEIKQRIFFSIIIPFYNSEKYISFCLDSIIKQHFKDFEVLIVDDFSSDNSLNIVEKYVLKDKRFKLLINKTKGVSSARNLGLNHASGSFVTFLDSDDTWKPNHLSIANEQILKNKYNVICFRNYSIYPFRVKDSFIQNLLNLSLPTSVWSYIFELKSINILFDLKTFYFEDLLFLVQYFIDKKNLSIGYSFDKTINYRLHNENSSHQKNLSIRFSSFNIIKFFLQSKLYKQYNIDVFIVRFLRIMFSGLRSNYSKFYYRNYIANINFILKHLKPYLKSSTRFKLILAKTFSFMFFILKYNNA